MSFSFVQTTFQFEDYESLLTTNESEVIQNKIKIGLMEKLF